MPGRNDPCPCGSGKKYKKCCLVSEGIAYSGSEEPSEAPAPGGSPDRELHGWKEADAELIREGMARFDKLKLDIQALLEKYWGKGILERWQETGATEQEEQQFLAWVWLDWRKTAGSKTIAEQMAADASRSEPQKQILASLNSSHMSVYQVVRLEPGRGAELENILEGGRVFVQDRAFSLSAQKWLVFFGRTYSAGAYHFSTGLGGACAPSYQRFIRDYLARELAKYRRKVPAAGWRELLRSKAEVLGRLTVKLNELMEQPPRLFNTDGEPLVLCTGTFTVKKPAAFLSALQESMFVESGSESEEGTEFLWLSDKKDGAVTLGRVLLQENRLVFECNSRERRARGMKLLRKMGGLDLVNQTEKGADELFAEIRKARAAGEIEAQESEEVPPEASGYLQEFLERHYQTWIDQRIPALGGRTPRQVSKSVQGRQELTELIRQMEYADSSRDGTGHAPYDWNKLRRRLGLASE